MTVTLDFWEQPEVVDRFAARQPDERLLELLRDFSEPAAVRVLDLGCAAGRNTVLLAERGFDAYAVDASEAMVAKTRQRLAAILGPGEAHRRARQGRMDDLGTYPPSYFHLVVALGIYHGAQSFDEWDRAVAETVRVLDSQGLLLTASFTPDTDLTGDGMKPVLGEPHVYEGLPSGRLVLMEAPQIEAAMARHALIPVVPSTVVRVEQRPKRRVTVNSLFRKPLATESDE